MTTTHYIKGREAVSKPALFRDALSLLYIVVASLLMFTSITFASEVPPTQLPQGHSLLASEINVQQVESGSLFLKTAHGYLQSVKTKSEYQVEITGMFARVRLSQSFANESPYWSEAIYLFPLTQGASVNAMKMVIGQRIIKGKIEPRKQAQKKYQQAKQQGQKAALIEQERPNLFTSSVANIPPGEAIEVSIQYLVKVDYHKQLFSLRLPLTLTPRYIPKQTQAIDQGASTLYHPNMQGVKREHSDTPGWAGALARMNSKTRAGLRPISVEQGHGWAMVSSQVPDASRITPPQLPSHFAQQAGINIRFNTGLPVTNIHSLYHPIKRQEQQVSLATSSVAMDRDFVIQWSFNRSDQPQAAFFKERYDGDDYGLILFNPPERTAIKPTPKHMTYIIDTSGSMGGVAIRQAKRALQYAVMELKETDQFNIISFNSFSTSLFQRAVVANRLNKTLALSWLDELRAGGGTEMEEAIVKALSLPLGAARLHQIVFITDGSVGNEQQLFALIEQSIAHNRLHTIGIGSAPNSYFMQQAAKVGRGLYQYIGEVAEVEQTMRSFIDRINRPLLTDIRIHWSANDVESYPLKITDLYAGEPLMISARWPQQEQQYVEVSGQINGQLWHQRLRLNKAKPNSGIRTLWARDKITSVEFLLRHTNEPQKIATLEQQLTTLALNHQILSRFTSFVAVETQASREPSNVLKKQIIANAMPLGSTQAIVFAQTATKAGQQIKVGIVLLFFIAFYYLLYQLFKRHC
ncbi:marine proteobacterial sortase target protein [Thalassotalea aquiviva]|uniref:marine proteobacterial sortase target protein n=1 Tax=Thalassotalea aquiviva TaxID=3242415 RepID=UPI00352AF3DD